MFVVQPLKSSAATISNTIQFGFSKRMIPPSPPPASYHPAGTVEVQNLDAQVIQVRVEERLCSNLKKTKAKGLSSHLQ